MKKLLKIISISIIVLQVKGYSQAIPTAFFGQNAWMSDSVGTGTSGRLYGKLDTNWNFVKQSNIAIVRYGGKQINNNKPSNRQYLAKVDSIKNRGMIPVIQVPYKPGSGGYDSATARALVKLINGTYARGVVYWIIGNEPDGLPNNYYAINIAPYIKRMALAMKNQDPTIKIIAPELSWVSLSGKNRNIMDSLTMPGGAYNIVGMIPSGWGGATGKGYIDYLSWHVYNFNGSEGAASVAMNRKKLRYQLTKDSTAWGYLKRKVDSCNSVISGRSTYPLKTVITEANICWNDSVKKSPDDVVMRVKASSFFAGQHWAEMASFALATGVQWINFWSVMEGAETGYITNKHNPTVKSTYQHIQKLGEVMKGTHYTGKVSPNDTTLKAFACKNGCYIAVFVMNEDSGTSNKYYSVNLNDSFKNVNTYSIKFPMGKAKTYIDTIEQQSSTLLMFDCGGGISKKYRFKMSDSIGDSWIPYAAKLNPANVYTVSAGPDQTLCCLGCSKTYTATISPNATGCTYQWYKNGTLVSGATFSTYAVTWNATPNTWTISVTITYTATGCTSSDDALLVYTASGPSCNGPMARATSVDNPPSAPLDISQIETLVPNPTSNRVVVYYSVLKDARSADLHVINYNGQVVSKYRLNANDNNSELDCSQLSSGIYFVTLIVDGKDVGTKKLVIQK